VIGEASSVTDRP